MYELQLIHKCKGCEQIIQVFCFVEPKELIEYSFFFQYPELNSQHRAQELCVINLQRQVLVTIFLNLQAYPVVLKMLHMFFFFVW